MKAIQFNVTIPRYILGLALGKLSPKIYWSGLTCTNYTEIPEPELPAEDWVLVKTRMGGVCGSDMSAVKLKASTYYTPLVTSPFVLGHENFGLIEKVGRAIRDWAVGDRVVIEPSLWCKPRGFKELCRFCAQGEINHCLRITEGQISPGIQIGLCKDTGGSWSPYFVAHESQIYQIPETITDENALMIEPFAIGLHAALQNFPDNRDKVLIIGAGTIGLCTLAALRSLGSQAEIVVLGRYDFQGEAARKLRASHVIVRAGGKDLFQEIAQMSDLIMKQPLLGRPLAIGGVDFTFDCVGSKRTLDDAIRLTRNGGRVVFVGDPGIVRDLDWTPIFSQELEVKSSYLYHHVENFNGRQWKTFDLAIVLMSSGKVDLGWMVTHKFRLEDYRHVFELTNDRGKSQAIKIAFEFDH
jgi:L-iditol 2-dehydrogenase